MLVDGHGAGHAGTRGGGDGVAALLVTLRLPLMGLHGGRSDPSLAPTHPGNYNKNNNNNIGPDYQNTIRVRVGSEPYGVRKSKCFVKCPS